MTLTARDLLWFEKLHRHGPLPSSFLHAYAGEVAENTIAKRLTILGSEDNTLHGGRYISRPAQQFATLDSRHQQLVYAINARSKAALMEHNRLHDHVPTISPRSWKHDHMAACVAASIELATLQEPNRCQYIFHDEVVARVGRDHFFALGSKVTPDRWCGIRYLDTGGVLLLAIEADCGTEPLTSETARKSIASNISQYEAWVSSGVYKQDLGTTGGIVVLQITTSKARMYGMIGTAEATLRQGKASYLIFHYVPEFGNIYKPPRPMFELLYGSHSRAGMNPFTFTT